MESIGVVYVDSPQGVDSWATKFWQGIPGGGAFVFWSVVGRGFWRERLCPQAARGCSSRFLAELDGIFAGPPDIPEHTILYSGLVISHGVQGYMKEVSF